MTSIKCTSLTSNTESEWKQHGIEIVKALSSAKINNVDLIHFHKCSSEEFIAWLNEQGLKARARLLHPTQLTKLCVEIEVP